MPISVITGYISGLVFQARRVDCTLSDEGDISCLLYPQFFVLLVFFVVVI